MIHDIDV